MCFLIRSTQVSDWGFPYSSVGKESACNAGDPGLIPRLGRSAGEGIGHPLQYSWASLVAQLVKNLPTMRDTWVRSLGWEDPLEKGKATHSSILAWRIPWTVLSMELQRVRHNWVTFTFTSISDWVKNHGPKKLLDCLLLIMTTSEWNGNQRSHRNQSLRNPKWWAETGGGRRLLSAWWWFSR